MKDTQVTAKGLLRSTALDNANSKSKLEDDTYGNGKPGYNQDAIERIYGANNEMFLIARQNETQTADNGEILVSAQDTPSGSEIGWHLYAINADDAWVDYTGRGVIAAIVDNGWHSYNHPDLNDNIRFDLTDMGALNGNDHGQNVMGLVGAEANGSQTVGVAYNADLTGELWTTQGIIDATTYADVINNSWTFKNPLTPISQSAIDGAVTNGRGGLGAVVVFSSGNYRTEDIGGNILPMQSSPHAIVVGAMDTDGTATFFSSAGSSLLITAPGIGLFTTHKAAGTRAGFSGTSGSAPIVSGTAALILEANDQLGFRDVQEIMSLSAQHNDPGNASWAYNADTHWNGGGRHFSNDHGYGNIDARAAVRLAETWNEQSTAANMQTVTKSVTVNTGIPDAGAAVLSTATVMAGENIAIESVVLNMDINGHGEIGDLVITLTSPDGTVATIMDTPMFGATGVADMDYSFGAQNFRGEEAEGLWTVSVQDTAGGNAGTWADWTLTINGDTLDNNDVYFYSDDFAGMAGARTTLTDSAGTDTINASMATGDLNINLNSGTSSTIAGNTLTIAAGTTIENVYGGDGNDVILGNASANTIWGGRGSDNMDGGAGYDIAEWLEDFADFTIDFVGSTMTATLGAITDTLNNFEEFIFNGVSYLYNDLYNTYGDPINNNAPSVTANNLTLGKDESVLASDYITATDPDGSVLSYEIWDSGNPITTGYFDLNGTRLEARTSYTLTQAEFDALRIVGGDSPNTEALWIRVHDADYNTGWQRFTLTTEANEVINTAPTATVADLSLNIGASVLASSTITPDDPDGDTLTYSVWDSGRAENSGYFELAGTRLEDSVAHDLTQAQFDALNIVGGSTDQEETLWVRAMDATTSTGWISFTLTTLPGEAAGAGNTAPTVTTSDLTLKPAETVQANTIAIVNDAEGDALTYEIWDSGKHITTGYFELDGTRLASGKGITLTADEFSRLLIVGGIDGSIDRLWVRASDGNLTSKWDSFHLTSADPASLNAEDIIDGGSPEQLAIDALYTEGSMIDPVSNPLAHHIPDTPLGATNMDNFLPPPTDDALI